MVAACVNSLLTACIYYKIYVGPKVAHALNKTNFTFCDSSCIYVIVHDECWLLVDGVFVPGW